MDAAGRLLWWLIAGSEGGMNRVRVIDVLLDSPKNAKQIADQLGLDYKTVRHHVEVLEKNGMVTHQGEKYGRMYFMTSIFEQNIPAYRDLKSKITARSGIESENTIVKK